MKNTFAKIVNSSTVTFSVLASLSLAILPSDAATLNVLENTETNFHAIVSGGDFDAPFGPEFLIETGAWGFSATVEGLFNDTFVPGGKEIVVAALLQHNMGPHGEGVGPAVGEIPTWVTNGQPFPQAPQPFVFLTLFDEPHESHIDEVTYIWSVQADGTDFVSWELEVFGEHIGDDPSIPEPTSTLALLALGILGAASTLKHKK